jgi:N6-adenosine-specific RNA methylase IME4
LEDAFVSQSQPQLTRRNVAADPGERPGSELAVHEACGLVPEMPAAQYAAFRDDIARRGVLTPLEITGDGKVLNGRHRLRAALEVGLPVVPVRVVEALDPVAHVLGAAVQQRWLTESQRAALALELDDWEAERAQGRARSRLNLRQYTDVATLPHRAGRSRDRVAERAGVSPRLVQDVVTVRDASRELFEQVLADDVTASRAAQQIRQRRRAKEIGAAPPMPKGPFDLVYADPPWQLGNPSGPYCPEDHYPTLPLEQIKALDPPVADDALCVLWVINHLIPLGLDVMSAWGFEYKADWVWEKQRLGRGRWLSYEHELMLIGRRGNFPPPPNGSRPRSIIRAKAGRHSAKPTLVYELLERAYPAARKVELYARITRPGWTSWGNEVDP